jgi:hypothetical protein
MPTNIALVGWNGTCVGGMNIIVYENPVLGAYEASHLVDDTRNTVNELDYRTKAVDQLAILVPMVVERRLSFQEYLDDILGGMTVLDLFGGRVFGKVYSGLLGVAVDCGIEDCLKLLGGHGC